MLATGLSATSLRPLAAAVGTSDRMLLYYFPDKLTLIAAILGCIAERLKLMLDQRVPQRRLGAPEMTRTLWRLLREPQLRPYMQIWLELAGCASRGEEPHRAIGAAIAHGFLDWIAARLTATEREARDQATTILTQIEGRLLLDAFGIDVGLSRARSRTR